MIKEKTILVLGAGASQPYGFPLGRDLRQQILNNIGNPSLPQFKVLVECGFDPKFIQSFHFNLFNGIQDTIDDFLDDRSDFREIGSFAIAQVLMSLELEDHVSVKHDWYPFLFKLLDFRKPEPSPIMGIVTFNYDRSLEHYLTRTTEVSFLDKVRANASQKLHALPIIHLHGQLGAYPNRPYGNKETLDDLREASKAVKITSDSELDDSPVYATAKRLVDEAKQVVFLGFGYHKRSLERLGLLVIKDSRTLYGTAHSIGENRQRILDLFQAKITLNEHNWTINDYLPRLTMK